MRTLPTSAVLLVLPVLLSGATAANAHAQTGSVLLGLALLVLAAKLGGLLAERAGQPSVLGELLAGISLGNLLPVVFGKSGVDFVRSDPTLGVLAEAGVLILLFDVGLEADLRAFVRVGLSATLVAVVGIVVPFALGWAASAWLLPDSATLVHLFIGATLTATSVGITARVLRDLGATQRPEAQTILGAAILDDVLGLIVLAVASGMVTAAATGTPPPSGLAIAAILLKAVVFLGTTVMVAHFVSGPIVRLAGRAGQQGLLLVFGLGLCFTLAYVAEKIGLAGIIGAFAAGLLLDPYGQGVRARAEEATLDELLRPIATLFVPLFFVLMGLQVDLANLAKASVVGFGAVLVVCALVGKLASGLGVVRHDIDRLTVAIGMVPRGEVGLIFAGIGTSLTLDGQPVLSSGIFSAVVLMVVITTLATPPGLRWALRRSPQATRDGDG